MTRKNTSNRTAATGDEAPPPRKASGPGSPRAKPTLGAASVGPETTSTGGQSPTRAETPPAEDARSAVGYGRPPNATSWKKGQSGNPKGKPKGCKSLKTIMTQWANGKVIVKMNGHAKTLSNMEEQIERLNVMALNGDLKAMALLLQLAKQFVPEDVDAAGAARLSPGDVAILQNRAAYMALVEEITGGGGDDTGQGDDEDDDA